MIYKRCFRVLFAFAVFLRAVSAPVIADELSADGTAGIPYSIANNKYLQEAHKQSSLALLALLEEDYEASINYSAEAVRYAELSDEFIKGFSIFRPKLAEAEDRLRWAETSGAAEYYPKEIDKARIDFQNALNERAKQNWEESLNFALLVIEDLANVAAPPPKNAPPREDLPKRPTQYKVRPWDVFGDCFWNIANWFYGNPWKWPLLYEANKHKLPDPGNPDLIEIGTILDIPSSAGEIREGIWDSGLPYIGML